MMVKKQPTLAELTSKLIIMDLNYWEHFKFAKDLSLSLPIEHPKRISLQKDINKILLEVNKIKTKISHFDK